MSWLALRVYIEVNWIAFSQPGILGCPIPFHTHILDKVKRKKMWLDDMPQKSNNVR